MEGLLSMGPTPSSYVDVKLKTQKNKIVLTLHYCVPMSDNLLNAKGGLTLSGNFFALELF